MLELPHAEVRSAWQETYREALMELDLSKLQGKVLAAETAIFEQLPEVGRQ